MALNILLQVKLDIPWQALDEAPEKPGMCRFKSYLPHRCPETTATTSALVRSTDIYTLMAVGRVVEVLELLPESKDKGDI